MPLLTETTDEVVSTITGRPAQWQDVPEPSLPKDHFVQRDGKIFAGQHLTLDIWEAAPLNDLKVMENTLLECVAACGATLLHIHLHHFTQNGGISGVAVLAESHISVHTWPERGFAAFDIFMCGDAVPEQAIHILTRTFSPQRVDIQQTLRGIVQL